MFLICVMVTTILQIVEWYVMYKNKMIILFISISTIIILSIHKVKLKYNTCKMPCTETRNAQMQMRMQMPIDIHISSIYQSVNQSVVDDVKQ